MDRRLAGWLPTLAICAIMTIAFLLGAWKTALILVGPALVSMPFRWRIPYLQFLSSESMERGAICLIVAALGAVALGLETASQDSLADVTHKERAGGRRMSIAADDPEAKPLAGVSYQAAAAVAPEVKARTVLRAIANARSCDTAHAGAAGAIQQIGAGGVTANKRAAVASAVATCEASWILFNRPELRDDPNVDGAGKDGMEACDEGYLGRWLANDNLLAAFDKGMPKGELRRIERMNSANDAAVSACGAMLRQYEASKS